MSPSIRWITVVTCVGAVLGIGAGHACAENAGPAAGAVHARSLHLKSGMVDTRQLPSLERASIDNGTRFVLQLDGPMTVERRRSLVRTGVKVGDYLPVNAFIASGDRVDWDALAKLDFVAWTGPFHAQWKLDPELGRRPVQSPARRALREQGWSPVVIVLFRGADFSDVAQQLEASGTTVLSRSRVADQWLVDAIVPLAEVQAIAALDDVQFLESAPEGTLRNDTNEWIAQSNEEGQTPLWDAGVDGTGEIVGLIDGMVAADHCAFEDTEPIGPTHRKIVALRANGSPSPHGTHVAGTLVGDSGVWGAPDQYDGLAFAARISFSAVQPIFDIPTTFYDRLLDAHNDGARIHSNSWGDSSTQSYTVWSMQADEFMYDHEEDLIAFAVSNTAAIRSPENALNVLAVSATEDTPNQQDRCVGGVGPTADGRRKPEIMAPGCGTLSADSTKACDVTSRSGTSIACPVAAAAATLVRQYFRDGFYPSKLAVGADAIVPSGALVRASLINATTDLTGTAGYPSDAEGWGRVLLHAGLPLAGDDESLFVVDVFNANGLATGEAAAYAVTVVHDAVPLRITMAFTAPAAVINASDPVSNDLDLEVTAPSGLVYRGNWLIDGVSVAGGAADPLNNLERVIIDNPQRGTYSIRVVGTAVNVGTQGFAISAHGRLSRDCDGDGTEDLDEIIGGATDCDSNGVPDECEPDCNGNGVADACDLADGTLTDTNGDLAPDECCPIDIEVPAPEPSPVEKNRYVSFMDGSGGRVVAFQVKLTETDKFPDEIGMTKWVGPPDPVNGLAPLQCTPEYRDWSSDPPVIHAGAPEVVPNATYEIRAVAVTCPETALLAYSDPLVITTVPVWGDCLGEFDGTDWTAPDGVTNFADVSGAIRTFQGLPSAPFIARVDVHDNEPNGVSNFADVQRLILAFKYPDVYPFEGPVRCP